MGFLVLLAVLAIAVIVASRVSRTRQLERVQRELEPVKRLAYEDVTALGEQLQGLDRELAGVDLDEGARADYQRALDAYESAKQSADAMTKPEDVSHATSIVEDGRYAIDCVRARVTGDPLPVKRAPCFFDPRHGISKEDVSWTFPDGSVKQVPACALDVDRLRVGAAPDIRQVMVGPQRVPYWQGGRQYQPYARGYFGAFGPLDWLFVGMFADDILWGLGGLAEGVGEGIGAIGDGVGDAIGGIGDGIGDMFDGFDF
ncbi:hypothetical protein [Nocardioides sp. CER19]|uniref:hypothetical protein n=1 Tax=Nocardioides sp. CER19 TaxID=3038538 RepID=UPI0024486E30|nr:hypothetical protein [Nocardioides sp. CER19]MDH2415400.1 hypothetical protein [Nocardioides sp. CER19]